MLEIIQGLAQAAANVYDGAHDERFTLDGQVRNVGLRREEGCPIMDKRVNDGFSVKFHGNSMCITYQSDERLKDVANPKYEQEVERMLNEIKKFLQREYKSITGNSVTLKKKGEPNVLVQSTSNVRTFVQAYQHYTISGIKSEEPHETSVRDITRKFLEQHSTKRPQNDTRKKETKK
jgi:hypothetical protein